MRLSYFLCLLSFMQVSAASLAQKISLDKKNASIKEMLEDIRRQSGYSVFYDVDLLANAKEISIRIKNASLTEALDKCFFNQPFSYKIDKKTILVTPKILPAVTARLISITGKIIDADNQPLYGVTVRVKDAQTIALSDKDGNYKIAVSGPSAVLIFSMIGFETQQLPVESKTVINVTLKAQNTGLNDVVIVGYGAVKRKDLTGSVAEVNMSDFNKASVKSFDEALAGRVAGVSVSGNDGQPGSVNNIVIRGYGSITQDNSPLYVVDGFPMEDGMNNSINPGDIESINVLKDASSTAIYGARGANGVIIITTKKGKIGLPVITLNSYYGVQNVAKKMDLLSPYEFVKYQLELNPTLAPVTYLSGGKTLESYRDVKGIDLQDYIYQTAPMQNYALSLRGGNDKTRYVISGNIFDQKGIVINSGFTRYQGRMNLDQTINKNLKASVNINYSNSRSFGVSPSEPGSNTSYSNNLFYAVWGYRPVTGGDNDSDLLDNLIDPALSGNLFGDYRVNPVISTQNQIQNTITDNLIANAFLDYTIIPGLSLRISGGITRNTIKLESFFNSQTSRGSIYNTFGVNGSIYTVPTNSWLNENTLTYKKSFKGGHNFNVLAGYTMQALNSGRYGFSATQVPNESLGLDGLDQSSLLSSVSQSSRWGLSSFLARVNYDYKSRYLLTASIRADGSSKFAPGRRWGTFPSGSFAWNMGKESFLSNLRFISDAKLRISYGLTGNNRIGDFSYLSQLILGPGPAYSYNNSTASTGAQLSSLGNPDLKWETTAQTNIGYDLSLFNNRINFTADAYRKTTKDLLLLANLPYTLGIGSAYKNIGKVNNEGLELSLNTVNLNNKNFTWKTGINISFNRNKVLELAENQKEILSPVFFDFSYNSLFAYTAQLGKPIAQMRGYEWDGVYQYSDFDQPTPGTYVLKSTVPTNGTARANIKPGDIKYKDLNGDLVVNADDITTIGRGIPIHTGGFVNDFRYKNFDLNVFFQWSYGNDLINANRLVFEGNGKNTLTLNQFATWTERWQPDNPSNTLFRTGGQGPFAYSSRIIEDGSYLRLKTVTLGYNLSEQLTKRLKIKSLRVFASAQNLLTWTNYSGPDPEVSIRNSALTPGFDYSAYPRPRTLTFGLNLVF
ncbi:TonB-dependent receptor [Pedobacter vanadiisoli]|uniref:TonB-dependent receptor n=1 Tax=Pedobacter vanadiisoli TaxID=1761975 RepID=A0ABW5MPT6_9SPHI